MFTNTLLYVSAQTLCDYSFLLHARLTLTLLYQCGSKELCNSHQCTCFLLLSPIREVFNIRLPSLQFNRCPKGMCIHRVKSLCKNFVHILVIKYNVMTA